jgi:hypothetical protein
MLDTISEEMLRNKSSDRVNDMATGQFPEADYQNLRQTVAVLEQRVTTLESQLGTDDRPSTPFPNIDGLQDEITRITQQLFPGKVAIEVTDDPEFPQDSYTVVRAQASGEIKEIEDRRVEWHERVIQLSENCRLLRLSLDYQS